MTTEQRSLEGGTCHVYHAFEAAFAIDLERAGQRLKETARAGLAVGERNVGGADFRPRPLRTAVEIEPLAVGGGTTLAVAHVTVFEFGAISVRIDLPLQGDAGRLAAVARAMVGNSRMRDAAAHAAERVLRALGDAAAKPALSAHGEDYVVFRLPPLAGGPRAGLPDALVARVLRAEEGELSADEVRDAVSSCIGYGSEDVAVVDWNAALVVDRSPEDALAVLEFANVELTEMRWLDDRLDRALEEAVRAAAESVRVRRVLAVKTDRQARRIAELQLDAVALFESVNNALKLFGDQWLARLHGAATRRMHIDDFERSVLRKTEVLDSIYAKLRDRQVQVRAEILEWIIIVLIAVEILLFLK